MRSSYRQQPSPNTQLKSKIAYRYGFIGAALTGLVLAFMALIPTKKINEASKEMTPRIFAGKVYQDINANGMMDPGELPLDSVKVRIFIDKDGDGMVSQGDEAIDSLYTNKEGMYEWQTFMSNTLVVDIDKGGKSGPTQSAIEEESRK